MAKKARVSATVETNDNDAWFEMMAANIAIDRDVLDECLIRQPQLYYDVSERLALALSLRDAQKDEIKVIEAEADEEIRDDLAKMDEKVTEAAVKAQVVKHSSVVKSKQRLTELDREVGQLQALKEAYSQRSHALRELCGLYAANYWGDGSGGSRASTAVKNAQYDDNRGALSAARKRHRDQD